MLVAEGCPPLFINEGQVRYYSLARHALIEALRLAGICTGSRVLLPEYLCRDLLAPLHLLGAVPCWYGISPDMTPETASSDWPIADVVLAVNYFGFPQDLRPFKAYAERTGAVVIEDNAHGYLSRDQLGQWLGCRSSLGIFSVRKTLRIPDGAALWVHPDFTVRALPAQLSFDGAGVNPAQLSKARLRGMPLMGELAYRVSTALVRALRKWRTGYKIPAADPLSEQELPAPPNPWAALQQALAECAVTSEVERRRSAYVHFASIGERVGAVAVFAELPQNCAPYAYAFRGDGVVLSLMKRHAASRGFDLVTWPDLPNDIVGRAPEHYRNVFLVNFLW